MMHSYFHLPFLPLLLLILHTLILPSHAYNTHEPINGTLNYSISTNPNYHYELTISSSSSQPPPDGGGGQVDHPAIDFLWKSEELIEGARKRRKFTCRIFHKSTDLNNKPSWIGFGVQDRNKIQSDSSSNNNEGGGNIMLGADAIIGFPKNNENGENEEGASIKFYSLHGLFEGSGGVEENISSSSSSSIYDLSQSRIFQLESEGIPSVQNGVLTMFDFTIVVDENEEEHDNKDDNNNNNSKFKTKGENLFIFAIGPSSSSSQNSLSSSSSTSNNNNKIGKHVQAGSFIVDFTKVGTKLERTYINKPINCKSDDTNYNLMMVLSQNNIKFYWTLDEINDLLHVQMKYLGHAWIGWGIADDSEGKMIGANAVIGRPALSAADGELPLKYFLAKKEQGGIYPLAHDKQTLLDASLTQSDEETIMRFTKKLNETDENIISKIDMTTFIFAVGEGNIMTKHDFSDSFSMYLHSCPTKVHEVIDKSTFKTAWIFHGVFGTMAFALFLPISVSSAFLRKLLPTSWIFLHAYGNILALSFTLIAVFIAVTTFSSSGQSHISEPHHKIGLSLLILASIQVINGLLRPNPNEKNKRNVWILFHRVSGTSILCLGLFQVGDGLNMFAEDYVTINLAPFYFVLLAVFAVIVLGARLWLYVHGVEERNFGNNTDDLELETERLGAGQFDPPETELT